MPSKGDPIYNVEGGNEVLVVHPILTNQKIREALISITRAVITEAYLSTNPRANLVEITMTSRLSDFVRINPHIFLGSKVGEDQKVFFN